MTTKVYLLYRAGESDYEDVAPDILLLADFDHAVPEARLLELTAKGYAHRQREDRATQGKFAAAAARLSEFQIAVIEAVAIYQGSPDWAVREAISEFLSVKAAQKLIWRSHDGHNLGLIHPDPRPVLALLSARLAETPAQFAAEQSYFFITEIDVEGTPPTDVEGTPPTSREREL
jgi:hypothetical protein